MAIIDGFTTARAHLDPLDLLLPHVGEIDYTELMAWLRTTDPNRDMPVFAGRYFLGHATQAEIDAGQGFCLWAHGEGCVEIVPRKIVPIQRADPARQSRTGDSGLLYGSEDAVAIARHLDLCLAVGDLELGPDRQILVFLEVADDTALSAEYWAGWATTLYAAELVPERLRSRVGVAGVQSLLPAVLCPFKLDAATQTFLPDTLVRTALDALPPPGLRSECFGFWARRKPGDPGLATHSFDWSNMGDPHQRRTMPGLRIPFSTRVPVRYLRWFDGPEGLPIPDGPLRETLALLSLDWATQDPNDDPLGAAMTATAWRADATDPVTGMAGEPPTQFGVDKNRNMTRYARCLATSVVNVDMMPAAYSWKDSAGVLHPAPFQGTFVAPPASGPCSLIFRYYSDRPTAAKNLTADEAKAMSAAGFEMGVTWEGFAPTNQGDSAYIQALIKPFMSFEGQQDGKAAFEFAADVIRQPPFTPVYFAVDVPVGDPDYYGARMPGYDVILRYFQDVHRGYRAYLADRPDDQRPYYVGVYGQLDVCEMLYRNGLASHFWQPWPPTWGASNWKAFRHANAWQIVLANTIANPGYSDMHMLNPDLRACVPRAAGEGLGVDINVGWGDAGTWQVFS